jgi:hypothetical protein
MEENVVILNNKVDALKKEEIMIKPKVKEVE